MNLDPIIISLIALAISIASVLFSMHNAGIDRRIQFEQLRGNMIIRLTIRGIEVATITQTLLGQNTKQIKTVKMLTEIAKGIVEIREKLKSMTIPPFFINTLTQSLYSIKSDIEDCEYIFDNLKKAVEESDFNEVQIIVTGLHERIYGKNKKHQTKQST